MDVDIRLEMDGDYWGASADGIRGCPFFAREKERAVRFLVEAALLELSMHVDDGVVPVLPELVIRFRVTEG